MLACSAARAQVQPAFTSTTMLAVSPSAVAYAVSATATATASVISSNGNSPATGTVSFYLGTTLLATATLANGSASFSGNPSGLAVGVYPVTAVYNGNSQTSGSTSAVVDFSVKYKTATTFSVAPVVVAAGAEATLSATVSSGGSAAPTGTVAFYTGSLFLTQAALANGTATAQVSSGGYTPGNYNVSAVYSGDAANFSSTGKTAVSLEQTTTAFGIAQAGAAIVPAATAQFSITPSPGASVQWYVNGIAGGSSALGTIDATGKYAAPSAPAPLSVMVSATEATNPKLFSAAVTVYVVVPGSTGTSNNPQVAAYTISAPQGGAMSVEFGLDTTYGRSTWQQPTPQYGGAVRMLVAGMNAPATYHMRADIDFGNGIVFHDADQTFASVLAIPPIVPTVTQTAGLTPQPGIEVINPITDLLYAYDLQGNFIWGMGPPAGAGPPSIWHSIKLLPNGHLLTQLSPESAFPVDGTFIPAGTVFAAYELELDGTIVRQVTLAQLNANLAASGYRDGLGNQVTLLDIHHDITLNPVTGHWIMLANTTRVETDDPGTTGPTTILGDVILDVDPNNNFSVDWVWNEFDHLDITRHPQSIQDWTHTNAIVYSPDDHALMVSVRYQNWILKVDYNDGAGAGDILWHFGYQGDFTLVGGTDPQDWPYAQHLPSFTTTNTTGVFGLTLMDNGDNRQFASGAACPVALINGFCLYSRDPQFTVDETAMTATLNLVEPFTNYSNFGGNAEVLANGDAYADFCSSETPDHPTVAGGYLVEYTPGGSPQLVWSMDMGEAVDVYRGLRWDSFYPGVAWTQ